jgi:hypothetical protein
MTLFIFYTGLNTDAFLLIAVCLYKNSVDGYFMNLRHSKPSYSYSESSPNPKISEIKVKEDPMLRNHAQLLVNFIERTNLKYQILQEKLRASRNKKKSKGKNSCGKKGIMTPVKKSKSKPKQKNSFINSASDVK